MANVSEIVAIFDRVMREGSDRLGIPEWDNLATTSGTYLGITRSTTPMWSSQAPQVAPPLSIRFLRQWEQDTNMAWALNMNCYPGQQWVSGEWLEDEQITNIPRDLDPDLRLPEGI